jgi:hypothetical protein
LDSWTAATFKGPVPNVVFQQSCQRCAPGGNRLKSVSKQHKWLPRRTGRLDPKCFRIYKGGRNQIKNIYVSYTSGISLDPARSPRHTRHSARRGPLPAGLVNSQQMDFGLSRLQFCLTMQHLHRSRAVRGRQEDTLER